uniref:Ssl1-like domain-containing protein n=1 Tax=Periophthalmus magnuspinnatus TaxID=409849 RepID=A0A3B3Z9T3_9GOBI
MDEEPERAKRWEGGYERTWSDFSLLFLFKGPYYTVSSSQTDPELTKPDFFLFCFQVNHDFLGIITTKNKRAERLTDLSGNPSRHTSALRKAADTVCVGEPSLYNALSLAMATLKSTIPSLIPHR